MWSVEEEVVEDWMPNQKTLENFETEETKLGFRFCELCRTLSHLLVIPARNENLSDDIQKECKSFLLNKVSICFYKRDLNLSETTYL